MPSEPLNAVRVEAAAHKLLEKYGIDGPDYEIEDLAAAEELQIQRGGLRNIEAWLVRKPNGGGIIRIRDDTPERGKVRFSIAHEIGHWILHPTLSQGFLCTAADMVDYARSTEEIEANLFAANLLMPRIWMKPETWTKDPDLALTADLAKEFGTTLTAASRRYVELTRRGVVLVFSKDSVIQWSIKSRSAQQVFIGRGGAVPDDSLTQRCAAGKATKGLVEADPEGWLAGTRFAKVDELYEDVRVSQTYGWALTLLWIPELG